MLSNLRLYLAYVGVSIRGQMQYRASFIMLSIGHFLMTGIEFFGVRVLFDRFGSLRERTLPEVALFYGLVNISFAIADATSRGFDIFHTMVKGGDFDRLRPRSAVVGGACLFYGLIVLQATLAFWTTETLEIVNAVTYGGVAAAQYPLVIYSEWFRGLFTYVIPLACISYYPAVAILGRVDTLGSTPLFQWLSPAVGIAFLGVSLVIWQFGVKHYKSMGS